MQSFSSPGGSNNRLKENQDDAGALEYDYDEAGNLTLDAEGQRFGYDAENRQKEFFLASNGTSTPDATYYFDGEGRRVKKISSAETTVFVYNASGTLVAEYSTALATTPRVGYMTADHLGSPRVITNQLGVVVSRHDYTGFGNDIAELLGATTGGRTSGQGYGASDEVRKQYTGYERDEESGLEYAQARYYNAGHGRFTSPDPLTASATIRDPQSFNRYSYVLNSPYKFSDPLGLLPMRTASACANQCPGSDRASGGYTDSYDSGHRNGWELAEAARAASAGSHEAQHAAPPMPPVPSPDLTDAQIRAWYPTFNTTDQTAVNQAIADAAEAVDPRGGTNVAPAILTATFRNAGDTSTPLQAVTSLDATSGTAVKRNTAGEITEMFKQNVFDGRNSSMLVNHDNNAATPDISISQFLSTGSAVAFETGGMIFLGDRFFGADHGAQGRTRTIIHEAVVHKGFDRSDTDFGSTRQLGSGAINSHIDRALRVYRPQARQPIVR